MTQAELATSRSAEIAAVFEAYRAGLRDKDAAAITALYAEGASICDLAPPLASSPDEANLALWLSSWEGPVTREMRDFDIRVSGNQAVAFGLVHMSARTHDGAEAEWWMRSTMVLERRDSGWLIVHEHESVPFYMDGSFRAALDLTP